MSGFLGFGGSSSTVVVRAHDTTYSPAAMWPFNGDLEDSIGTSDLTVAAGSELYSYCEDLRGFMFNGLTTLQGTTNNTALMVTGDLTVEFIFNLSRIHTVLQAIIQESGTLATDSGPTNGLWAINLAIGGALNYFAETTDSGTNVTFTATAAPTPGTLHHLAMTRASNVVKFYLNGVLVATSGTLTTPTFSGTPLQRIEMGNSTGLAQPLIGFVSSVKIVKSALTADNILREYN